MCLGPVVPVWPGCFVGAVACGATGGCGVAMGWWCRGVLQSCQGTVGRTFGREGRVIVRL